MQLVNSKINLDLITPVKAPPLSLFVLSPKPPLSPSFCQTFQLFLSRQTINPPSPPTLFALKGPSNMNFTINIHQNDNYHRKLHSI